MKGAFLCFYSNFIVNEEKLLKSDLFDVDRTEDSVSDVFFPEPDFITLLKMFNKLLNVTLRLNKRQVYVLVGLICEFVKAYYKNVSVLSGLHANPEHLILIVSAVGVEMLYLVQQEFMDVDKLLPNLASCLVMAKPSDDVDTDFKIVSFLLHFSILF